MRVRKLFKIFNNAKNIYVSLKISKIYYNKFSNLIVKIRNYCTVIVNTQVIISRRLALIGVSSKSIRFKFIIKFHLYIYKSI